ncbi:MAG: glutathione S-transferase family protein [Candidatus Competibacteraceae bacterium]|nr:glutathione S-transferase family protein [Candidatus Competibacteraceae bacterium]
MTDIKLYSAQVCPFAQRTRLGLLEKNLEAELVEIDLQDTPDWFHDISPYGKVPVLERGSDRVVESAIINEYLEEVFPEPPLMPRRPGRRALARFWIDFANTTFVPRYYKLLLEQDPDKQAHHAQRFQDNLRFMEDQGLTKREQGPYWLGPDPTLVDLAFYPFFERLCVLEHYRGVGVPANCPRLYDWWNTMRQRESVRRLMNPPDFYIQRYTHYADGSASGSTAQEMREA